MGAIAITISGYRFPILFSARYRFIGIADASGSKLAIIDHFGFGLKYIVVYIFKYDYFTLLLYSPLVKKEYFENDSVQ